VELVVEGRDLTPRLRGEEHEYVVVVDYGIAVVWERTMEEARMRFYRPSTE